MKELISAMWDDITRKEILCNYPIGSDAKIYEKSSREKIGKLSKLLIGNFLNIQDRNMNVFRSVGSIVSFNNGYYESSQKFVEEKGVVFVSSRECYFKHGLMKYRIFSLYSEDSKERHLTIGTLFPIDLSPDYLTITQINKGSFIFPSWKTIEN